jgi:prophage antirepressor-like protein
MDIVRAFNTNDFHTEIVIKGDTNNPLFRASDIGNVLDIANIRTSINDFNETEKVVHTMDTLGGTQQVKFLTEKGLYKVLFKSRKPIAEKFQNWVCEVIKEIRLNGIYDLQKELDKQKNEMKQIEDQKKKEYEEKLEKQKILEREKILLKEYAQSGPLVYIIKVKTYEKGQYVVKIGESRKGIQNRYAEHKSKYDECLLLDCFNVQNSKDFENFIHNHESIKPSKVNNLLGHETELELFLIGKNLSYQTILNVINNNLKYFNGNDTGKLQLEIQKLNLLLEMKNTNNNNLLIENVHQLTTKINNLEKTNQELLSKINFQQTKVTTGFNEQLPTLGPRLQKIHPESLELIKIYETVTEAMKENSNIKRPSVNKAIVENTIYEGYRWLLVDRELDPNIIHNIQPTKLTKVQHLGYIAQMNSEKTEITNVYLDRKTAAHFNGYSSSSALDNPVKNCTLTKGFYYKLYDECDEELKELFEEKNGQPLLYKNGVGQFDNQNNLVKEFACKYDCLKALSISDKTLAKALNNNMAYNGFYFKEIGPKLKIL